MINNKYINNYFLFLFCVLPLTIVLGSTISLINIILIDISFLILIIYERNFNFIKSKPILYLFLLYAYLIFNSFISIDFNEGFFRNFGFIRIILLFMAFNFFFLQDDFYKKVLKFWLLIILIVLFDVFIEAFFGKNILGFSGKEEGYGLRIVSFFKDEPIVGSYLSGFYLIIVGFLMTELKNKNILFGSFTTILIMVGIFLTGERSITIKTFLGFSFFLLFINLINIKKKIIIISATITLVLFAVFNPFVEEGFLKHRYGRHLDRLLVKDNVYFLNYKYGFEIFKENKIFGVGNKNYRIESCKIENIKKYSNLCNTHPHQIYFELLSEHGIVGSFIIMFILFRLVFSKIFTTLNSSNYLKLGTFVYMALIFTPLLPSGAFFSNYLLTIFAINLSIFYASDKKLNIFSNQNK